MDIPCQQCICFAACKNTVPMRNSGAALMSHIEVTLRNKCSILNEFIYYNDDYSGCGNNLHVIMDYFRSKMGGYYE